MGNLKNVLIWLLLILLIVLVLALNYLKFFGVPNSNIQEIPVENSTSIAIQGALTEIVNQFNQHEDIVNNGQNNIDIKAILNQYSIYVHYGEENVTTTYEFNYSNLKLSILVDDTEENLSKFGVVYKILLESCQRRLKNFSDFGQKFDNILTGTDEWNGVFIEEKKDGILYQLDITKKMEVENVAS